jgi:hypothetical protein
MDTRICTKKHSSAETELADADPNPLGWTSRLGELRKPSLPNHRFDRSLCYAERSCLIKPRKLINGRNSRGCRSTLIKPPSKTVRRSLADWESEKVR